MIKELKISFKNNRMAKKDYIQKMFGQHELLLEYSSFLAETDISKIEIVAGEGLIFTTRPHGVRLCCPRNDSRSAPFEMMNFGEYESGDSSMMYALISSHFTVFDVGANIGWHAMNIARIVADGRVIAFEPISDTHQCLCKNVRLNGLKNIETYNLGLHEREGDFVFHVSGDTSVSSSLTNITHDQDSEEVKCKATTIDRFVEDKAVSKIDFIKCDVEGAELFVFKGGAATINRHKPIVFSEMLRKWSAEFGYHPNDIIHFFGELGYACFFCAERKLVRIQIVDDTTTPTNFFFLHREKHGDLIKKYA